MHGELTGLPPGDARPCEDAHPPGAHSTLTFHDTVWLKPLAEVAFNVSV